MRRLCVFAIVALAANAGLAWAQQSAAGGAAADKPPAAQTRPAVADGQQPAAGASPQAGGESWRYRRHRGTWWYWLPTNRWVVWTDGRWVDYVAKSDGSADQPRGGRAYSYSNDNQGGLWGPVRYDRWGQPQYPYSRRKSGLRQLGPVPAMGGVRSLPGWGGER